MTCNPDWTKFEDIRERFPEHDNELIKQQKSTIEHAENYSERTYYLDGSKRMLLMEKESRIWDNEYGRVISMLELNYFDKNNVIEYTSIMYSAGAEDVCPLKFAKKYPPTQILYRDGVLIQKFVCEFGVDIYTFYQSDGITVKAIAKIYEDSEGHSIDFTEM